MSFISFSARRLYGGGRDDDREGWGRRIVSVAAVRGAARFIKK